MIVRFLRRHLYRELETAGEGVATGAPAVAAPIAAPAAPAEPTTMLEAIERGLAPAPAPVVATAAAPIEAPAVPGQPRDAAGRFTFKNDAGQAVDANGVPAPDQAAALAAQAAAPAPAEDADAMPADASPKAQVRIRELAAQVKERDTKLQHYETELVPAVQAMHEIWAEHQVKPEQFQQAMAVVGMMNRGDFVGAQAALLEQLQQLAQLTGQPVQVDVLQGHADLQAHVRQLTMTPEAAAEVARARAQLGMQQRGDEARRQQQAQQQQQQDGERQAEAARTKARGDVDAFCQRMKTTDLDYAAIEAQLLPVIKDLVQDVPPARWPAVIERQYQLIKTAVGSARRSAAPTANPLRPGQGGGTPQPQTMFDAMWNRPAAA